VAAAYSGTIRWLRDNPLGLSYAAMNLLVFVILFPAVSGLLLFGALGRWG